VAYDEDLADRVRAVLPPGDAVTERQMFGGLVLAAYLSAHRTMINGSALCAALAVTERD
jgi:hypothetical protein